MKKHYYIKAKAISRLSTFSKVKIGCVAVYHKNIIGVGFNQRKTNPLQAKYNVLRDLESNDGRPINDFIHAEMSCINAIKDLDVDFSKVELYIYRENMNNELACCKPCKACEQAIRDLGIKRVYYTDTNKYIREDLL
jgi:deoxycytidylate deaminase